MQRIPQTDPRAGYLQHQAAIDDAVCRTLTNGRYILGPEVQAFEEEFARFIGVGHAVGVANGTDAVELALRTCGVRAGDAVVTVSHTAVATVAAIRRCGAVPVFVDIDRDSYTMTAATLTDALRRANAVGVRVKAVVVVHLYGRMADMPAIRQAAAGLKIVEDCAQAHGAALGGVKAGAWGDAGAFSFYPTKNLGTLGDGGAVVTRDAALASTLRELRQYGWRERYISAIEGINSRLDELQAAILRVRLPSLDAENQARVRLAALYTAGLAGTRVVCPQAGPVASHVYHQYVVRVSDRVRFRAALSEKGIDTAIHYPQAVHQQPAYHAFARGASLAITESVIPQIVSLPMYPQLTRANGERVVTGVLEALTAAAC